MIKGGLDASFFIVYVGQDTGPDAFTPAGYDRAYKSAIEKFDAIHRLTEQIAPDKIGLALTSADARKIYASGRKVAFIGVENGYPIGEDIAARQGVPRSRRALHVARAQRPQPAVGLEHRRARGLEVERPVAARQAGDRRDEPRRHHDRRVASVEGIDDADAGADESADHRVALVGAEARRTHSRNLDDEQLLALKKNGGVMQTVAFSSYVKMRRTRRSGRRRSTRCARSSACPTGTPLGGRRQARRRAAAAAREPAVRRAAHAAAQRRRGGRTPAATRPARRRRARRRTRQRARAR